MAKNGNIHPTRIFKSPDELERAWIFYKEDLTIQASEWFKVQYVGKEGNRVTDVMKLPYTMEGFEVFCYKNFGTVNHYFDNKEGLYTDFGTVCSYIKKEIRSNQITGGLLGVYNPSITQRLNSLVEKTEDVTPQQPKNIIVKIKRNEE
jgi:hypothetical protein